MSKHRGGGPRHRAALLLVLGVVSSLLGGHVVQAIYPDGHFDYVTKITDKGHLEAVVADTLKTDDTLFVLTKAFAESGNKQVRFADITLSEAPISGPPYDAGKGGWPTIRYFNKETGKDGAPYQKKTDKSMCDELGNFDNMLDYVEEAGNTALCAPDGSGCDERSAKYMAKFKAKSKEEQAAQLKRLEGMDGSSMKQDLLDWKETRKRLLKTLLATHHTEL
ncbi:glutathione peroxidase [Seminavis robusta]|uniref:Glutathione peroxidase n=1 Tax=Seminavis robusta TaxID=568900 RepID=A0A9N8EAB5_9STRA|nr:glutathione peroxidase [Seminavis robusta]|eukprot:Sro671_g184810.1 glutathione peroxidase (221) ;mRNA; r:7902-8836